MPLPFIIGGIALVAGVTGAGTGISGAKKMKTASDRTQEAKKKQEAAIERFNKKNDATTKLMDSLGKQELEIMQSFSEFSDVIGKIQGRPEFKDLKIEGIDLPTYEAEDLKKISVAAGTVLGGAGGATAGSIGGVAAAGGIATLVAVGGTASTGTAIASLSGAAATNATLAAIGGGSLAAGGGGMALGTAILGGATLGVGLLIGGAIFNATGQHLSDKADEAFKQAAETERQVKEIVQYLNILDYCAEKFQNALTEVEKEYRKRLDAISRLVNNIFYAKTHWADFTDEEKKTTENLVLLTGILYKMCKVNLVTKSEEENKLNSVNYKEIDAVVADADKAMAVVRAA